jgi:hypothetical protein
MLDPVPYTPYCQETQIQVIFQGYHPLGEHLLSITIQTVAFQLASNLWLNAHIDVAKRFGVDCVHIPWMADEIKWEVITFEQGLSLSAATDQHDAPSWYWDINRPTRGLSRKSVYVEIRTMARTSGDKDTLYILCHRVSHMIYPIPPIIDSIYFQWIYCTGGTFANSGQIQVCCRPEDDYNTFMQRFFETSAAAMLWPRAFALLRKRGYHTDDDFRLYMVPNGIIADIFKMITYLTDGKRKALDRVLWRLKWGGRGQRFHLGDILPSGMMLVIMNSHEEAKAWADHSAYLRLPMQLIRLPGRRETIPEDEFGNLCRDMTANYCDDVNMCGIQVNERIKRPMYVYHTSIIRYTVEYGETLQQLMDATTALISARAIYLTPS